MPGYDYMFSSFDRNTINDEADVEKSGRLFYRLGLAEAKIVRRKHEAMDEQQSEWKLTTEVNVGMSETK